MIRDCLVDVGSIRATRPKKCGGSDLGRLLGGARKGGRYGAVSWGSSAVKSILSWGVLGVAIPTLLFFGIGALTMGDTDDFLIAKISFLAVAVVIATKVVQLAINSTKGLFMTYTLVFCAFGVIGIMASLSVRYVDRKYAAKHPAEVKAAFKPKTILELFQDDFPTSDKHALEKEFADGKRDNVKTKLIVRVHDDFQAQSKYISAYIPFSP